MSVRRSMGWGFIALVLVLSQLVGSVVWAHSSSNSFLTLHESESSLKLRLDVHLRDVDVVFDLDQDRNGQVTWGEVLQRRTDLAPWLLAGVGLSRGTQPCDLSELDLQASRHADGTYLSQLWQVHCAPTAQGPFLLHYSLLFDRDPLHRGLLKSSLGGTWHTALLSPEQPDVVIQPQGQGIGMVLLRYLVEGVWHIWIGLDHVLFLLSLLLLAPLQGTRPSNWQGHTALGQTTWEVLKVVTAFTLAHSITLALSVLQWVTPPAGLVEPVIALSVALAAFNNLLGHHSLKRWPMAFAFGLIHGFGFASVLLDLGLPTSALVTALGGFNVGVELGQLAIVLVFLPLAWWLRHTSLYRWLVVGGGSLTIGMLGLYWMLERLAVLPDWMTGWLGA